MTPREQIMATVRTVASRYCATIEDVTGPSRDPSHIEARWDVIRALHEQGMRPTHIGRVINRDYSTVSHALKTMAGHKRIRNGRGK